MHFDDYGAGRAVVLLHSVPGTTASFAPLARALSSHARVLVPAMPGYGTSRRLEPYDLSRVCAMLEDELLSRGVHSCAIVGHSGGTYRALSLTLRGRLQVEAMVLLGAVAGFDENDRENYRQLSSATRAGADLRPMYRETAVAPDFARRQPERLNEILAALEACPSEVLADEFQAFAEAPDLRPKLSQVRCRTLLRVGARDAITPPAWSDAISLPMPDARVQVVDGCGHCLLQEDEAVTIESIVSWLAMDRDRVL